MKVKELLKVLFDDQCVELLLFGVECLVLFEGFVRDVPEVYLEYSVSSCRSVNSIIRIGCFIWR